MVRCQTPEKINLNVEYEITIINSEETKIILTSDIEPKEFINKILNLKKEI